MDDAKGTTTQGSTVEEWTSALAESTGDPGGGAASGVMLAIAAALTSMVAGYTKPAPDREGELADLVERALELRRTALRLADDDAAASSSFGAAFRLEPGEERERAIQEASAEAARASAALGARADRAIVDLEWLAAHGNPTLVADLAVACGALRAAVSGARTNVSFDLASLTSTGDSLPDVRERHPRLWETVHQFDAAIARIDALAAAIDDRAAPTD
jgi:formiminotetrahydrofolate cyclodeaminase